MGIRINALTESTTAPKGAYIPADLPGGTRKIDVNAIMPVGTRIEGFWRSAPTGFLACDGTSYSRTTYADLYAVVCENRGTVTMTIASPCVVTLAAHGLQAGDAFFFETTGALPTNVSANTQYFVLSTGLTTDTFRFAATAGGSAINSSGSQSGVHNLRMCQHGIADASTFRVPDMRGLFPRGAGAHGTMTKAAGGAFDGGSVGSTSNDSMQGHYHDWYVGNTTSSFGHTDNNNQIAPADNAGGRKLQSDGTVTGSKDQIAAPKSDGTNGTPRTGNETKPASMSLLYCIKY